MLESSKTKGCTSVALRYFTSTTETLILCSDQNDTQVCILDFYVFILLYRESSALNC